MNCPPLAIRVPLEPSTKCIKVNFVDGRKINFASVTRHPNLSDLNPTSPATVLVRIQDRSFITRLHTHFIVGLSVRHHKTLYLVYNLSSDLRK